MDCCGWKLARSSLPRWRLGERTLTLRETVISVCLISTPIHSNLLFVVTWSLVEPAIPLTGGKIDEGCQVARAGRYRGVVIAFRNSLRQPAADNAAHRRQLGRTTATVAPGSPVGVDRSLACPKPGSIWDRCFLISATRARLSGSLRTWLSFLPIAGPTSRRHAPAAESLFESHNARVKLPRPCRDRQAREGGLAGHGSLTSDLMGPLL